MGSSKMHLNMIALFSVIILPYVVNCYADLDPFSDEFIEDINRKQSLWRAERIFPKNTSLLHLRKLFGVVKYKEYKARGLSEFKAPAGLKFPKSFDAREEWKDCTSISEIRDQGSCGSCWAFGTAESMTDRICIHSNATKKISVSSGDLVSCCCQCGNGCFGGDPIQAWRHWESTGIVSGGGYKSGDGCKTYFFPPCEHYDSGHTYPPCGSYNDTPSCRKTCDEGSGINYADDLTFGKDPHYINGEENMKADILLNGPIAADFIMYQDILSYRSGIYKHVSGDTPLGGHAIKIIGWGEENGVPYWLIVNSMNRDWGENGYFRMLRGSNECSIENEATAGLPVL